MCSSALFHQDCFSFHGKFQPLVVEKELRLVLYPAGNILYTLLMMNVLHPCSPSVEDFVGESRLTWICLIFNSGLCLI